MKIAIVGFSGCGKSTCFRAITGETKNRAENLDPTKSHLAAVKIIDPRLEKIKSIFHPKKLTYAEIILEDLPGFHIPEIKEIEALMEVVGVFSGRDPAKDITDMDTEFMLLDSKIIDRRLPDLEKELKQKSSADKDLEHRALLNCKDYLKKNMPLRILELAPEEEKAIRGFQFLSKKPAFALINTDENRPPGEALNKIAQLCKEKKLKCMEFCGKLEAEINELEEPEKETFLKEFGITGSARKRVIELAYDTLGHVTFFTVKGGETKAWSVKDGTQAIEAAGKIHSDIQKGFIKAEVVNFSDLASSGSVEEARKKALLKLQPKEYKIRDGDIVDFRFSK